MFTKDILLHYRGERKYTDRQIVAFARYFVVVVVVFTFLLSLVLPRAVFDLGICRVGTLICYDVSFSEAWRIMALKGAEVVLGPSAGRKGGMAEKVPDDEQLKRLSDTLDQLPGPNGVYAAENALYSVNCNQFGFNGHSTHKGGASIIDPVGKVITRSEPLLEDLMITATLDPEPAEEMRRGKGFSLRTRRPEIYGELTRMI